MYRSVSLAHWQGRHVILIITHHACRHGRNGLAERLLVLKDHALPSEDDVLVAGSIRSTHSNMGILRVRLSS